MLNPKMAVRGGPGTSKQPSEFVGRLLDASREKLVVPEDPGLSLGIGGHVPEHQSRPFSRPWLGSSHAPSIPDPLVGLAVAARPRLTRNGASVGVQPPLSNLPTGREDCWLLVRRSWLCLGTLASAMLPGVTPMSLSPAPLLGPVLGLATHQHLRPWGRVNCSCSSTRSPKMAARGGPASSKQPSEWT